jgi:hypothetical protein
MLGQEDVFRADAAFARPEIYEALEERGVKYATRNARYWLTLAESHLTSLVECAEKTGIRDSEFCA